MVKVVMCLPSVRSYITKIYSHKLSCIPDTWRMVEIVPLRNYLWKLFEDTLKWDINTEAIRKS